MSDLDLVEPKIDIFPKGKPPTPKKAISRKKAHSPTLPEKATPPATPEAKETDITRSRGVVDQPVDRPIDRLIDKPFILVKTAFYLPEDLSDKIDEAVAYLKKNHKNQVKKVDRSSFLSALLSNPEIWAETSLDKIVDQVVKHLISRATGQPVD